MQGNARASKVGIGGRAVILVDASGNVTRCVELHPRPVLLMWEESHAQAGEYLPSWRRLLPASEPECQAARRRVDAGIC